MGKLLLFLRRHVAASLVGAGGVLLGALGFAEQAGAIITRFEPWQLQAFGAALFVVFVVLVLASYDADHQGRISPQLGTAKVAPTPQRTAMEAPSVSPPAAPDIETRLMAHREGQKVMQALQSAQDSAAIAVSRYTRDSQRRLAEKELPKMRAALLSSHKHFGTPPLPEVVVPENDLEVGRRLIEKMLPFLREGHVDEARHEAEQFLERFKRV